LSVFKALGTSLLFLNTYNLGWGYNSKVKFMLSMYKAGLDPYHQSK
jgi:hypothetical protein